MAVSDSNGAHASAPRKSDLVPISVAARMLGLSQNSIRDYVERGELKAYRFGSLHRRFSVKELHEYLGEDQVTDTVAKALIYARVSTKNQDKVKGNVKSQLASQVGRLKAFAKENYGAREAVVFSDCASSLNFKRDGLTRLLSEVLSGMHKGSVLLVEFPDRIMRFGRDIVELICDKCGVEIRYIEREDVSDEQLLQEDVLSCLHIFSIRMFSARSSERRRKVLSESTLKRGKELLEAGLSINTITERLGAEGFKCEDGSEISSRIVRTNIYLAGARLEEVLPKASKNSAQLYYETFAESACQNTRLPLWKAFEHYLSWCRAQKLEPMEKQRFSAVFSRQFRKSMLDNCFAFRAVRIKGEALHRVIKPTRMDLTKATPVDALVQFLASYRGTRVKTNELWRAYCQFCKDETLAHMGRNTFGRILINLGCKKRRAIEGWQYEC